MMINILFKAYQILQQQLNRLMLINPKYCCAAIFFVFNTLIILFSVLLAFFKDWYVPEIRAPIYGIYTSILGLIIPIFSFTNNQTLDKFKRIFYTLIFLIGTCALFIITDLQYLMGTASCILWLFSGIVFLIPPLAPPLSLLNKAQSVKDSTRDDFVGTINSQNSNQQQISLIEKKQPNIQKCLLFFYLAGMAIVLGAISWLLGVACYNQLEKDQYPPFGHLYTVNITNYDDQQIKIHAYCINPQQTDNNPTFFMEHGGGSNSIAFVEFGLLLKKNYGWRMCSYDRLGYGRSDINDKSMLPQDKANLTRKVISQLQQGRQNKDIILGGWSFGVEIVQIYYHLFPENVKGLVFLDGYPDYLLLDAIYNNQSSYDSEQIVLPLLAKLIFYGPFGYQYKIGSNPIANDTTNAYYSAYYHTGYLWQSQFNQIINPITNTAWLTEKGANYSQPYPNQPLDINWPDINIPLLILPASNTIDVEMFAIQCQKYLQKCTNQNKKMVSIEGNHDFILQNPQKVASAIHQFYSPLFHHQQK